MDILEKIKTGKYDYLENITQTVSSEISKKPIVKIELIGRSIPFSELVYLINQIYKIEHTEYEIIVRWNNYK